MQQEKKKIPLIVKLIVSGLLVILLAVGIWLADYFLIPKAEQTGVRALVENRADMWTEETDTEETEAQVEADPNDKYPVLLDTFPEELVDQPVEPWQDNGEGPGITVIGASDDGVNQIVVTKTVNGTGKERWVYYVADVRLKNMKELKTCFAQDTYGENIYEQTSSMAERCNAVLAINGDCYGWRDDGIIIRNGQLFRDVPARQGLALYEDGRMELYDETQTSGQQLLEDGVWNTFSFGPELIQNGEILPGLDQDYKVDLTGGVQKRNPRTAIGQIAPGHLIFVVADGRQSGYSHGIQMQELAELMQSLGCETAYNLDGGASTTMYFKGQIVNHPSSKKGERSVSDCIFIN